MKPWIKPPPGMVKSMFDASFKVNDNWSIAIVARNLCTNIMGIFYKLLEATNAEALAFSLTVGLARAI